jgi:hypothetical protein
MHAIAGLTATNRRTLFTYKENGGSGDGNEGAEVSAIAP